MSFHPQMEYAPAKFHKSARTLADEGPAFAYTPENQAKFDANIARYPAEERKSAVLYALYLAQGQQGYLTAAAMSHVAQQIGCTAAEVEDVVSYYSMFFTKPVGTYVLNVCRTLSCALRGAERVTEEIVPRWASSRVKRIRRARSPSSRSSASGRAIARRSSWSTTTGTSVSRPSRCDHSSRTSARADAPPSRDATSTRRRRRSGVRADAHQSHRRAAAPARSSSIYSAGAGTRGCGRR